MMRAWAMWLLLVLLFWPLHPSPRKPVPAPAPPPPTVQEGARLYHRACLSCHGPRGNGEAFVLMPNGQAAPRLDQLPGPAKTVPELMQVIGEGRGLMPAWRTVMTPREIQSLALYVASLNPASPAWHGWAAHPRHSTPASFR
jgi:mono/diheme cytochrome c family protein